MNRSLYVKKSPTVHDKEEMLDRVLGDYPTLRETFNKTLKKHIDYDGQKVPGSDLNDDQRNLSVSLNTSIFNTLEDTSQKFIQSMVQFRKPPALRKTLP
jgi:hypothetical protein